MVLMSSSLVLIFVVLYIVQDIFFHIPFSLFLFILHDQASAIEFRNRAANRGTDYGYDLTFQIMENQRRVRIFSAILILVSSMQLLTLLTIYLGVNGGAVR